MALKLNLTEIQSGQLAKLNRLLETQSFIDGAIVSKKDIIVLQSLPHNFLQHKASISPAIIRWHNFVSLLQPSHIEHLPFEGQTFLPSSSQSDTSCTDSNYYYGEGNDDEDTHSSDFSSAPRPYNNHNNHNNHNGCPNDDTRITNNSNNHSIIPNHLLSRQSSHNDHFTQANNHQPRSTNRNHDDHYPEDYHTVQANRSGRLLVPHHPPSLLSQQHYRPNSQSPQRSRSSSPSKRSTFSNTTIDFVNINVNSLGQINVTDSGSGNPEMPPSQQGRPHEYNEPSSTHQHTPNLPSPPHHHIEISERDRRNACPTAITTICHPKQPHQQQPGTDPNSHDNSQKSGQRGPFYNKNNPTARAPFFYPSTQCNTKGNPTSRDEHLDTCPQCRLCHIHNPTNLGRNNSQSLICGHAHNTDTIPTTRDGGSNDLNHHSNHYQQQQYHQRHQRQFPHHGSSVYNGAIGSTYTRSGSNHHLYHHPSSSNPSLDHELSCETCGINPGKPCTCCGFLQYTSYTTEDEQCSECSHCEEELQQECHISPSSSDFSSQSDHDDVKLIRILEQKNNPRLSKEQSTILFDAQTNSPDVNAEDLVADIRSIERESLAWAQAHEVLPVAYGIQKIRIGAVITNVCIDVDDLLIELANIDGVADVKIIAFKQV